MVTYTKFCKCGQVLTLEEVRNNLPCKRCQKKVIDNIPKEMHNHLVAECRNCDHGEDLICTNPQSDCHGMTVDNHGVCSGYLEHR
jgi:hypothetical protein